MRRALNFLLAILVFPLLTACVELEQTLVVNPDGSGKLDIRVRIQKAKIEELKQQMAGMGLDDKAAEQKDPFDVKKIKDRFKKLEGVRLAKIEKIDDDLAQGMDATIAFDSPDKLVSGMRALVEGDSTRLGNQMQLWFLKGKGGKVQLVYYPSGRAEYRQARKRINDLEKMSEREREMQGQMFELMKSGLKGLKIAYRFKVPAAISKVIGATKTEADQAAYSIDATKIKTMAEMTKVSGVKFVLEFDGKGFTGPLLDREPTDAELAKKRKAASQPARPKAGK